MANLLKEPFVDYTNFLPNNRAWATRIPYTNKSKELHPYTECTAINNGWVWNIPLWSRFGTGYVYSDKFISPDDALQEFKDHLNCDTDELEFKDISMRVGLMKESGLKMFWQLDYLLDLLVSLESNGLLSVHEFLLKFVDTVGKTYNGWDRMYSISLPRVSLTILHNLLLSTMLGVKEMILSIGSMSLTWRDFHMCRVKER